MANFGWSSHPYSHPYLEFHEAQFPFQAQLSASEIVPII